MSKNVLSVIVALFVATGLFAADEKTTAANSGDRNFDTRIDTWMEGTIIALDADGKTFSVRGWKMPVATAHAEFKADLHAKTKDLQGAERQAKEQEVRKAWQDRLANAKAEKKDRGEPSDFSFGLPEGGKLTILEGRNVQNVAWLHADSTAAGTDQKAAQEAQPVTADRRDSGAFGDDNKREEAAAMMTLKDLKVGDRVMVGYDSGVITNTGYVVVKSDKKAEGANKPQGAAR